LRASNLFLSAVALAASLASSSSGASAHPHVWVTVEATVLYTNGSITGLKEAWTFDEFYTATAIEGLDANRDGKYDRQELAELAKVNIDGLKEFAYFTYAKLGSGELKFATPADYWLEHTDKGILTLHFTLPLEHAVLAEAPGFTFSVYDPSFFIAFDLAKDQPVKLGANAPTDCKVAITEPADENSDAQQLNQAFSSAMGGGGGPSFGMAKTVAIQCAKS
jgi:ABC-type uncharacterized transport system substrate-binding protein